jgi:hypothetical protein
MILMSCDLENVVCKLTESYEMMSLFRCGYSNIC